MIHSQQLCVIPVANPSANSTELEVRISHLIFHAKIIKCEINCSYARILFLSFLKNMINPYYFFG